MSHPTSTPGSPIAERVAGLMPPLTRSTVAIADLLGRLAAAGEGESA